MKAVVALSMGAVAGLAFAATALAFPASGEAALSPAVQRVVQATGAHPRSVRCMIGASLASLSGSDTRPNELLGLAQRRAGRIVLQQRRVCGPIADYARTGLLTTWTLSALTTVGHEAAHLRGISREPDAECAGVRFAWRYLRSLGVLRDYVASDLKRMLLSNANRSPEYRLRGCTLA